MKTQNAYTKKQIGQFKRQWKSRAIKADKRRENNKVSLTEHLLIILILFMIIAGGLGLALIPG